MLSKINNQNYFKPDCGSTNNASLKVFKQFHTIMYTSKNNASAPKDLKSMYTEVHQEVVLVLR